MCPTFLFKFLRSFFQKATNRVPASSYLLASSIATAMVISIMREIGALLIQGDKFYILLFLTIPHIVDPWFVLRMPQYPFEIFFYRINIRK